VNGLLPTIHQCISGACIPVENSSGRKVSEEGGKMAAVVSRTDEVNSR